MVGPGGDWLKHSYDEPARLFSETDGCRVLTRSRHELLRRVPEPLVHVFAIGSTAPAALLYDALDSFDKGQAKADETLRLVGAEMLPAVAECIEAAGHEFEPQTQKLLLRAAAFGACGLTGAHEPARTERLVTAPAGCVGVSLLLAVAVRFTTLAVVAHFS